MTSDNPPPRRRFLTGRIHGEQPVWRQVPTAGANPSDVLWGGVWCGGPGHALIVGDGGVVIERTTVSASALPSLEAGAAPVGRASPWAAADGCPSDRVLWSVWGDDGQVFAVGDEGAIVTFDGQRWAAHAAPSPLHLHGVWGRRADQVYAVGDFATVLEFDGARWREIHRLGIDVSAVAVAGFGPHDLFVVGDEGLILRSDGVGFERIDARIRDALYAIWGLDADHVLAVGDFGAILRWNGREWNSFSAGTEAFLYGVCGRVLRRWTRRRQGDLLAYLRGLDEAFRTDEMEALQIRLEPPGD